MSGTFNARPVWAGLAVRMADGSLFAVELDKNLTASIEVSVEEIEATLPYDTFRSFKQGEMTVEATIRGTGRKVARFEPDMGVNQQPGQIESKTKAIES